MNTWLGRTYNAHLMGEVATHPNAALAGRLALLLRVAGSDHAALSRLATHPARAAFGYVQLRFLGSKNLPQLRLMFLHPPPEIQSQLLKLAV